MTMKERNRLRKLQDKWLDMHQVRTIISAVGWDGQHTDDGKAAHIRRCQVHAVTRPGSHFLQTR